jgi:hypothetical protein
VKATNLIAQGNRIAKRQCTAMCKSTGSRCQRPPIPGGNVCRFHGGAAPQVQRKAAERLKALVDPAIVALQEILSDPKHPHRMAAVKEVLERDGRIGAEAVKAAEDAGITFEQLEVIVRRARGNGEK